MHLKCTATNAALFILLWCVATLAPARQSQETGIRAVDFYNFEYPLEYAAGRSVRVRNGKLLRQSDDEQLYVEVRKVVYGDLTGDTGDEAVVLTLASTGGTGQFTDGFVYAMRGGVPVLLGALGAGDRADGGIHDVAVRGGRIVVERYGRLEPGGACCPQFIETEELRLVGGKFVAAGRPARRAFESYVGEGGAPQRIRFLKGSSSATLVGSTLGAERYLLGARAGQTLSLTLATEDETATVTLSRGGATPIATARSGEPWSGALPASGDYVVAVHSKAPSNSDRTYYTVELSIR